MATNLFNFTPVVMARIRHDGWTQERQRQFVHALSILGTVGAAARAVGMTPMSAYQLRRRADAESFAGAWDAALAHGRATQLSHALDCAINGATTVKLRLGGVLELTQVRDLKQLLNATRAAPHRTAG